MRISNPLKLVYLIVGVVCLILGVIGLIIPIIPGVLFLMAAVYLLSRGSRRIKQYSEKHPQIRHMRRRMHQFGQVNLTDRCRLAGWMAVDTTVKTVRAIGNGAVNATKFVNRKVSSC